VRRTQRPSPFLTRFLLLCCTFSLATLVPAAQTNNDNIARARKILNEFDDLWRGQSSYGKFTMHVKTRHYSRTLKMEGWSKGTEQTLVRILKPLKEKGTATLKSQQTIYSYLPRTDRTIRLTSGMMMGSWMGSHFTNDDLVKESRLDEDYIPRITFEGKRDGQEVLVFELEPKPEAPVVWGKLELMIAKQDNLPVYEKFFDEDMRLARTLTFSQIKPLSGRPRPSVMRLTPADKRGEYTEFIYDNLQLDIPIKDSFFSLSNLKRY